MMSDGVSRFCAELIDLGLVTEAARFAGMMDELDLEADTNPHATACFMAVEWVLGRQERGVVEKLRALQRVCTNNGVIRLPADLGWT
jgi:hypothetical protein